MRVTVVGAGYVGIASALALAASGHEVRVLDIDEARIAQLSDHEDPLGEPHVGTLLRAGLPLSFTMDPGEAYRDSTVALFAVGTPPGPQGAADLQYLGTAAETAARFMRPGGTVVVRSTVPVGTADHLRSGPLRGLRVISNPEFLREGRAIEDSLRPDRIVGGGDPEDETLFRTIHRGVLEQRYAPVDGLSPTSERPRLFWMDRRSAELAKYAANAFLATKLSFVNEIANVAASVGADIRSIAETLAADPRIGPSFLRPGIGWGGSCFPKDTRALAAFAAETGYEFLVLRAAIEQNNAQLRRFHQELAYELRGKGGIQIGLLGLAFKAGTADCRDSPATALAELLLAEGWSVAAYDPAVRASPLVPARVRIVDSALEAARGADALVIATEWPDFAAADLGALRAAMRGDLLFDGRCIVDPEAAAAAGLRYRGVCPPARVD